MFYNPETYLKQNKNKALMSKEPKLLSSCYNKKARYPYIFCTSGINTKIIFSRLTNRCTGRSNKIVRQYLLEF